LYKKYYRLTKPGIIYGNSITLIAGFLYASKGHINFTLLIYTLVGVSLVIASACVFNNFFDRRVDKLMNRTKQRELVTGSVPIKNAIYFGSIIGVVGFLILYFLVNNIVFYLGLLGFIDYIILYGISKRQSVYSTLIGSFSGATPITAGYIAVTGQINSEAIILFLILMFWQMPHFYSISLFRLKDYKSAKLKVLPLIKGIKTTKYHMLFFVILFSLSIFLLGNTGNLSVIYMIIMLVVCLVWLLISLYGFKTSNVSSWARKYFYYSLIILLIFSVLISINQWI